jgi:hypothetical protein
MTRNTIHGNGFRRPEKQIRHGRVLFGKGSGSGPALACEQLRMHRCSLEDATEDEKRQVDVREDSDVNLKAKHRQHGSSDIRTSGGSLFGVFRLRVFSLPQHVYCVMVITFKQRSARFMYK